MKFTPNRISDTKRSVTSYRLIFGSGRMKKLGLIDQTGKPKEIIPVITKTNIVLLPIDEKLDKLTFDGYTTTICKHGSIFFGEIENVHGTPTWYTTSEASIEQAFHKAVSDILLPFPS